METSQYLCKALSVHEKSQQQGLEPEPRGSLVADLAAQRTAFCERHRPSSLACSPGSLEHASIHIHSIWRRKLLPWRKHMTNGHAQACEIKIKI